MPTKPNTLMITNLALPPVSKLTKVKQLGHTHWDVRIVNGYLAQLKPPNSGKKCTGKLQNTLSNALFMPNVPP